MFVSACMLRLLLLEELKSFAFPQVNPARVYDPAVDRMIVTLSTPLESIDFRAPLKIFISQVLFRSSARSEGAP